MLPPQAMRQALADSARRAQRIAQAFGQEVPGLTFGQEVPGLPPVQDRAAERAVSRKS